MPTAADQTFAHRIANQLNYNVEANTFFGYSGMGYIGGTEGFASAVLQWQSATTCIWVVPATQPRVKVLYVEQGGTEETPQAAGAHENMQSIMESVPLPTLPLIPTKELAPEGTDKAVAVWCPATGEYWEFWRLHQMKSGEWASPQAGYIKNVYAWNGNWYGAEGHALKFGSSASGLVNAQGCISWQDIQEVLRGQKTDFGHMLKLIVPVTAPEHLLPAHYNDSFTHTPQFEADGITPNPAFGFVDEVPEGATARIPPGSHAADWGINTTTEPLATAYHNTLQKYGFIVQDSAGNSGFRIESPIVLGSPYSWCRVNPLAGYEGEAQQESISEWNALIGTWGHDPSLPKIKESFTGKHGIGYKLRNAYNTVELVETYAE